MMRVGYRCADLLLTGALLFFSQNTFAVQQDLQVENTIHAANPENRSSENRSSENRSSENQNSEVKLPALKKIVVRHVPPESQNDYRDDYFLRLLEISLNKIREESQEIELIKVQRGTVKSRVLTHLKEDKIDVAWAMTSAEREQALLPVRVPLLRGLLGYRIFIIREEDQNKFDEITSLEQLKQLMAGQGHDWQDTKILRQNGFQVVTSASYMSLFDMLALKRFDYFPRGVFEPWRELRLRPFSGLAIEKKLMLYYYSPVYFFVKKGNHSLANRLEKGLLKAMVEGDYDKLFHSHPYPRPIFDSLDYKNRIIFSLQNKDLMFGGHVADNYLMKLHDF